MIAGNEISAGITMVQTISTLTRRMENQDRNVRQRVDVFLGPTEIDDSEQVLQGLRKNDEEYTTEACIAMLSEHPLEIRLTQEFYDTSIAV